MIFGLAQRNFFKILFIPASLPSRGRLLFSDGKNFLSYTETFFHHFQVGESENFLMQVL